MRGVLAAVLAVGGAVGLAGCEAPRADTGPGGGDPVEKERHKAGIERVLREDARTNENARTVAEVVARMRAVDTAGCPTDFRAAYLAHVHAWERMADVEREAAAFRARADSDGVLVESFIRGMLGDPLGTANEMRSAQTQLQRDYQAADRQVKDTFHRVEELAVLHGASLPR